MTKSDLWKQRKEIHRKLHDPRITEAEREKLEDELATLHRKLEREG